MNSSEHQYFELLKLEIVKVPQETYPAIPNSMTEWMGSEITHFQEDLLSKQKGNISDKWFYTHMKSNSENLPRIDVLNLLAKYAGYVDWTDFKYNVSQQPRPSEEISTPPFDNSNKVFYMIPILVVILLVLFIFILNLFGIHII